MDKMTEDRLVQQTTANYMRDSLGWESVFAYNEETFGPDGLLGRASDKEVVLSRYLRQSLEKLNPALPSSAYDTAIKQIVETSVAKSTLQMNREKYNLFKNGVLVSIRNAAGVIEQKKLRVFDFEEPKNNHFLAVRELWIQRVPYRRRADIVGFVNGIPLLFVELKNVWKDIRRAYNENLTDYKDTIPHLFDHNAFVVLSNGVEAKIGAFSGKYEHFFDWKRLAEETPGIVDMETLLKGICSKKNLMDIFENFILFDDSKGKMSKIVSRNHQFLGTNRATESVLKRKEKNGQLGVFWHTQGSGKSYSMVFFSEKVHRKLAGNFTFLIVTDREDLDSQIYKTFAGCGIVDNDKDSCRAASGDNLVEILKTDKPYVFTMIHKFNKEVDPESPYSRRSDIIVISDEAHRTQYGTLAYNMRKALPNAAFIGFTGTPLFKDDELTRRIFGEYVSTYDFQRAVDDKATVPLYYDNRGEKLKIETTAINQKIAEKIESLSLDEDQRASLEKELGRDYPIITAKKRLRAIARDFVKHYTTRWETGKAMMVCIDKLTAVKMYDLIQVEWQTRINEVEEQLIKPPYVGDNKDLKEQLAWLKETKIAVVVSEEQNEVKRFKDWDLDIIPHRTLMKTGFALPGDKTLDVDLAFKDDAHPFRVVIVCAMWLTGFDVPSLGTLYLDKPLKAHTLMQAIARANRVNEGKNNGLIVDYCGILKSLREALATFTTGEGPGGGTGGDPPVRPEEDLLTDLAEAIEMVVKFLSDRDFDLSLIIDKTGFERNAAIVQAKEAVNQSEETRKRFEILARAVFSKFKSCLTIQGVGEYKPQYSAIDIIYKRLQDDRDKADITSILKEMQDIVDEAIAPDSLAEDSETFDMSKIDFEKLKKEFQKSAKKNTTVQSLKDQVEKRLERMIKKNPLRTDFYKRYQEIIAAYNLEKDRGTIEKTFEELLKFISELDKEDERAIREGLNEEDLALFDLLLKPELTAKDRERLKKVAKELLDILKAEKLRVDNWREKEQTLAEVRSFIYDYLWNETTGLPADAFTPEEVEQKAAIVFDHVFRQYASPSESAYAA